MASSGWSLEGRTALITGAARGIGADSARKLARRGMNVSLAGLEPEELERVAADIGDRAAWFETDVTDWDALEDAVTGTVERFGGIDVVVANAGIAAPGFVRHTDPAPFEKTIEINLLGVWRTVRACLPQIMDRQGYVLVHASMAAAMHAPAMAAYSASKAGAEAFANCLRLEMRHHGVDVGCGYFSWIATDMVAGSDEHPAFGFVRGSLPGLFGRTYPVSAVGDAVARGVERRDRWVVVPGWARAILRARGLIGPLVEREAVRQSPEMERRFKADVETRGAEEASAPIGAGGQAARDQVVNRS